MSIRLYLTVPAGLSMASGVCLGAEPRPERTDIRRFLAEPIKKLMEEEKAEAVAVGEFTGPAQLDTNAGPGIQQLLTEELLALEVNVRKKANLSVKGRYAKVADPTNREKVAVKVTAEVLDRNDERKGELHALLSSASAIARSEEH